MCICGIFFGLYCCLTSVSHQALWMMEPKEISDWQHEEFYRYVAQSYDKPRYTLHYRADAPLNIRSIFYVPDAVRSSGLSVFDWSFTAQLSECFIKKIVSVNRSPACLT